MALHCTNFLDYVPSEAKMKHCGGARDAVAGNPIALFAERSPYQIYMVYVIGVMWKVAARRGESNKCINGTDRLESLQRLSIYIQFENRLYGCRYIGRIVLQTSSQFFYLLRSSLTGDIEEMLSFIPFFRLQ